MLTIIFLVFTLAAAQGQNSTTVAPAAETDNQIIQKIENALKNANEYLIELLELIVKLVKACFMFINNIQSGNSNGTDIGQLTASIKRSFNSNSNNCSNQEQVDMEALLVNTTTFAQSCYTDVNRNIQILIPNIVNLLNTSVDTINNVSVGINNCIKDNPMFFGLPSCIFKQIDYVKNNYEVIKTELTKIVTEATETVKTLTNDTKGCVSNILADLVTEVGNILFVFMECVYE